MAEVGLAALWPAVRAAGADEHGPGPLVLEVELDLLERSLDEERGEGVDDWPQPGEGEARRRRLPSAARGCRR